ncbi:saccharopine dehydrogenase family protein [Nocardia sp. XZ_19_369]|uniref:saccharopine dehydrogenase family protein n=1 Tax=Nocardia sp. XZ_19_369 TaxID=2769487 RepID=UPI00189035F7|nr:saccharopine dehydrogenase NADP-binding domain-containing protein [Nocardia sp. XZ_19_369]
MRVLALGGAGAMGSVAVRTAAGLPGVQEIIVADRDVVAAQDVVDRLSGSGAELRASRVDVTDRAALYAALREVDVVLNTVGPYYRFGLTVLRAAIDTGTHYLDICDDWEPTMQMLEYDGDARAAGVCAIVGIGASPGVSNLLAARAARELDRVEDIYTAWPVDVPGAGSSDGLELTGPNGLPSAAAVHWMQQISGTITVVRAGQLVQEPPLRPVPLTLPGGRSGTAYTVGHPEPVTLHWTLQPAGRVANLMIVTPGTAAFLDVVRTDIDKGALTNETAAAELAAPTLWRGLRSMARSRRFAAPGNLPPFFAVATGTKDGVPLSILAHVGSALIDDMAEATGIPLALGLSQLVDGVATRPGVHPPEAILEADRFFADLAGHTCDVVIEQAPLASVTVASRG